MLFIFLLARRGPCRFPDEYSKHVSLFELADEHQLITSTDYDRYVRWGTFLLPIAFCTSVAFPMMISTVSSNVLANKARQALSLVTAAAVMLVCLSILLPLCPAFGTDSRPLSFDVDGTPAFYLASVSPTVIALIDIVLCKVATPSSGSKVL